MHGDDTELTERATGHVADILAHAVKHGPEAPAVVVFDSRCALSRIVGQAYRRCLPRALHLDFDAVSEAEVLAAFETLSSGQLVVLVQSTSFRLEVFRIRVELFKRGLKVIEHPHLSRMGPLEVPIYVDALAYDRDYYRGVGAALKGRIDRASSAVVDSGGVELFYACPLEPAKLNVGDYTGMPNVGGQFPIGEVFTEAQDLEKVHGRVRIFVFGDVDFRVNAPPAPITLIVERGKVVEVIDSTPDFDAVLAHIRADEDVWVRELGFGMNRAFTEERRVSDIGTYERMCGIHLSLGAKHGIFDKPGLKRKDTKHHVDVFAITKSVRLDDTVVFRDGQWVV